MTLAILRLSRTACGVASPATTKAGCVSALSSVRSDHYLWPSAPIVTTVPQRLGRQSSPARGTAIILLCVALNLAGAYVCRTANSILFLDLVGTALASLIYGPIHGALVGLLTNGIAEFGQRHYFLFAVVQVVAAGTWGLAPRLLKGAWCIDFFMDDLNDDGTRQHQYGYAKLIWGLIWLSLLSHLLASLTIAFLMLIEPTLSCVELARSQDANSPNLALCQTARLIFAEDGFSFAHPLWELAVAKAVLAWPDHLIALAFAVLMVPSFLPDRRHKMTGPFDYTPGTWKVILITALAFVGLSLIRVYRGFHSELATITDLLPWFLYTLVLLTTLLLASGKYEMLEQDLRQHVYTRINPDLEHAFEDALRLGVVYSTVIFVVINSLCGSEACQPFYPSTLRDKFEGALGVIFLITFFRYISLILARSIRSVRNET
jgi:hypothetical protein